MSTHRLASLRTLFLAPLTATVAAGWLFACSAAPDGTSASSPESVTSPDVDSGPCSVEAGHPMPGACPALAASDAKGQACLSDLEEVCASPLAACGNDCACTEYLMGCFDQTVDSAMECFSDPQSDVETAMFDCGSHLSGTCNLKPDARPQPTEGRGRFSRAAAP